MLVARDLWVSPVGASAPIVRGVSFELRRGEWLGITGPNGGGKSTLLLALAGLLRADRGSMRFGGREWGPGRDRAEVAVVLQDLPSQLLQPSVVEEIGFGPRNLGWSETEVARASHDWSARLGLDGLRDRDPRTLSAGFQQLTLLAAALAARPRLLLVDEGGAHLDLETRCRVLALLREAVAGGLSLVWVTQERAELAAADRILWVGPPEDEAEGLEEWWSPARAGLIRTAARVLIMPPPAGLVGPRIAVSVPTVWEIPERGVAALEGPNGSGKTTLLGAVAGLETIPQVKVEWLDGCRIGPIIAAQHPEEQIFAESVQEEVLFAATQRGLQAEDAIRGAQFHFEALGMGGSFMGRRAWSLSLGEKRILQVVAALIAPASVVLLDEPTSGLDPGRRSAMMRLVSSRSEAAPVIASGHDVAWLERTASSRIKLGG